MTTVHVVEPGGLGGVHHHAAAVACALSDAGATVVLHTAADAEPLPLPGAVTRRTCLWRFSRLRPAALRRTVLVAGWLLAGVPRLLSGARRGDVVHIEGRFVPLLLVPLVAGARQRGCTVAFSPHNTFPRRPRPLGQDRVARWLARHSDVVFAFSDHDRAAIDQWGATTARVPIAVGDWPRGPDPALVAAWRRRWGDRPVVLLAGHLRGDKGLDVAVEAAAYWRPDAVLAVVGEDKGALAGALSEASARGVDMVVDEGYHPMERFLAAVAAADVVVLPYRVASASAVQALAVALGRPTVTSDVGGLAELATVAVPAGDPVALAAAVDKALAAPAPLPAWPGPVELARSYLAAY